MKLSLASATVVAGCLLTVVASARDVTMGVIIAPAAERDQGLSDNLTEVAMAKLGETPGYRVVGAAELRRRIGADAGNRLHACVEQPSCLGHVAVALGVSRIVTGVIRADEQRYLLSLSLTDIATGQVDARLFKQVDGDLAALVRAVQDGVGELVTAKNAHGRLRVFSAPEGARVAVDDVYLGISPLVSGDLRPGPHRVRVERDGHFPWKEMVEVPAGGELDLRLGPHELPLRHRWAPSVGYGSAAVAMACLTAGGVFGTLARIPPTGQSRQEAQADLEQRRTYGRAGTALLTSGAALAVVSAVIFYRYHRDVFGD